MLDYNKLRSEFTSLLNSFDSSTLTEWFLKDKEEEEFDRIIRIQEDMVINKIVKFTIKTNSVTLIPYAGDNLHCYPNKTRLAA